jgi:predicted acylesterase/phospholipase RssA
MPRRALFMATGANRGAWYAGLMGPLAEAGIEFELIAEVSAGGIAASWFAAGDIGFARPRRLSGGARIGVSKIGNVRTR